MLRGWKAVLILVVVMLVTPKCAQPGVGDRLANVHQTELFQEIYSQVVYGTSLRIFKYSVRNADNSETCFVYGYNVGMLRVTCP